MIDINTNVAKDTNFNQIYFELNRRILSEGKLVKSRNGDTRELLNFKTIITNPYQRCVGGYGRDVNIFFLLAEALWIWAGRKDVEFLNIFNSNMKNFSDDGKTFHAPYGFRMRNWGVKSEDDVEQIEQLDQILEALEMLDKNPDDRRVVISIWNPEFDLNVVSKDIPCNDLIMFKIREGKLYTTVQNRSNDLHWGLLTNIFQFSFISNIMAEILGLELGEQVHNSQSLHVYTDLKLLKTLEENYNTAPSREFYESISELYEEAGDKYDYKDIMKFNFESDNIKIKLIHLDLHVQYMISRLLRHNKSALSDNNVFSKDIGLFCSYFGAIFDLLKSYVDYKHHKDLHDFEEAINSIASKYGHIDIVVLALNFVYTRMYKKGILITDRLFLNL